MKKTFAFLLAVIAGIAPLLATSSQNIGADWSQAVVHDFSVVTNNVYPDLAADFTRGGDFDGNYVLLANRTAPKVLLVSDLLQDNTSNPILLDTTGVHGGVHAVSAGRLSHGHIYLCNMTFSLNNNTYGPLKVYHYTFPTATPELVLTWDGTGIVNSATPYTGRLGDNISVNLDENGNGYVFFFKQEGDNKFFRFTVTNFTQFSQPTELTLPAVCNYYGMMNQVGNNQYLFKSTFSNWMFLLDANGTRLDEMEWGITTDSADVRHATDPRVIEFNHARYLLLSNGHRFNYWGNEGVYVFDISEGDNIISALANLEAQYNDSTEMPTYSTIYNYQMPSNEAVPACVALCNAAERNGKLLIWAAAPQAGMCLIEVPSVQSSYIAGGTCGENNNLSWTLSSDSVLTISGTGAMTDYRNPGFAPWYSYRESIKTVIIGDSVTSIGKYAFYNYTDLDSIIIPNSVTSIGYYAFYNCIGLDSVTIPSSITSIGSSAFSDCSGLTSVEFKNPTPPTIESFCFSNTTCMFFVPKGSKSAYVLELGLNELRVIESSPDTPQIIVYDHLYEIGANQGWNPNAGVEMTKKAENVFEGDFTFAGGSDDFYYFGFITELSESWSVVNQHRFGPASDGVLVEIGEAEIHENKGQSYAFKIAAGAYTFTVDINNMKLTIAPIKYNGTCGDNLTWVLQDSVLTISGTGAMTDYSYSAAAPWYFYRSSITSVNVGDSVTSIGNCAFYNCSSLTSITIPNSVTSIGNSAFSNCFGLTSVEAPSSFFDIDESSWSNYTRALQNVRINAGVLNEDGLEFIARSYKTLKSLDVSAISNTELADETFNGYYNLDSLRLPSSLQRISYMMVADCKNLKAIEIPASVVEIEQSAFENCRSLQTVTFNGNNLTRIGNWAFFQCLQLQNITIPDGVTEIGDAAFYECEYLNGVSLPASVSRIGDYAFANCTRMNKLHVQAAVPPTVNTMTFDEVSRTMPVYVPDISVNTYKADPQWGQLNIVGASNEGTALDNANSQNVKVRKVFQNGQLYIVLSDGTRYSVTGKKIQ